MTNNMYDDTDSEEEVIEEEYEVIDDYTSQQENQMNDDELDEDEAFINEQYQLFKQEWYSLNIQPTSNIDLNDIIELLTCVEDVIPLVSDESSRHYWNVRIYKRLCSLYLKMKDYENFKRCIYLMFELQPSFHLNTKNKFIEKVMNKRDQTINYILLNCFEKLAPRFIEIWCKCWLNYFKPNDVEELTNLIHRVSNNAFPKHPYLIHVLKLVWYFVTQHYDPFLKLFNEERSDEMLSFLNELEIMEAEVYFQLGRYRDGMGICNTIISKRFCRYGVLSKAARYFILYGFILDGKVYHSKGDSLSTRAYSIVSAIKSGNARRSQYLIDRYAACLEFTYTFSTRKLSVEKEIRNILYSSVEQINISESRHLLFCNRYQREYAEEIQQAYSHFPYYDPVTNKNMVASRYYSYCIDDGTTVIHQKHGPIITDMVRCDSAVLTLSNNGYTSLYRDGILIHNFSELSTFKFIFSDDSSCIIQAKEATNPSRHLLYKYQALSLTLFSHSQYDCEHIQIGSESIVRLSVSEQNVVTVERTNASVPDWEIIAVCQQFPSNMNLRSVVYCKSLDSLIWVSSSICYCINLCTGRSYIMNLGGCFFHKPANIQPLKRFDTYKNQIVTLDEWYLFGGRVIDGENVPQTVDIIGLKLMLTQWSQYVANIVRCVTTAKYSDIDIVTI
jgi:hypothetical protein